jgi:outer membrane protein OmpA-like peptidoglycan-associated protein
MRVASVLFFLSIGILVSFCGYAQEKKNTQFFFDTDISEFNEDQTSIFNAFLINIKPFDIVGITITGYCDDRGSKAYNDVLSIKRANYVASLLKQKGIDSAKIILVNGNGKINLSNTDNIDFQRETNRRVDLTMEYFEKSLIPDTLKVGDKIVLEDILFVNSRSILLSESMPVLERVTRLIKEKRKYSVAILGHICCNPPGFDVKDFQTGVFNLSHARAKVIYDYFIFKGVEAKRLSYKGMMANYPLGKGEKADRRVELLITGINPAY